MKRLLQLMSFMALFIFLGSCRFDGGYTDNTPPDCDFSATKTYTMTNFSLGLPNIQSTNVAFNIAFNNGGVIYNLNTLLETKGDYRYPENEAAVYGKMTADGSECKGEKEFEYNEGDSNVMSNSVAVPVPSNSSFYGEVTVKAKTDSFREQGSGYNQGFYVRWEVTENDGDNFVEGNIQGEKINFDYDQDMMYIPEIQEPIYIDGNWGLPSEPTEP
ncbi:hypothetical protein [Gillisia sp. Hel_I_29]|uniref:hypothetical protein n=1 Tax=Gillisia sp. Hel_I_29 TaxID=1249975 RepID=UPI0012E0037D|nr:hypothetical protein [Gillisia sp. Hel_I_29]